MYFLAATIRVSAVSSYDIGYPLFGHKKQHTAELTWSRSLGRHSSSPLSWLQQRPLYRRTTLEDGRPLVPYCRTESLVCINSIPTYKRRSKRTHICESALSEAILVQHVHLRRGREQFQQHLHASLVLVLNRPLKRPFCVKQGAEGRMIMGGHIGGQLLSIGIYNTLLSVDFRFTVSISQACAHLGVMWVICQYLGRKPACMYTWTCRALALNTRDWSI